MELKFVHSWTESVVYTRPAGGHQWKLWNQYQLYEGRDAKDVEDWVMRRSEERGFPIRGKHVELV